MSKKEKSPQTHLLGYATLVFLSLIWGSSFFLIKKGLVAFSPEQVAGMRISFSGLAFLPVFIFQFKKIDWKLWKPMVVVALAGSAVPAFLFATAQTEVSSSVAGVLNSLSPLFVLILGFLFFQIKMTRGNVLGVILGFSGALVLILFGAHAKFEGDYRFALLIVLATIFYGLSANTVQKYFNKTSPLILSAATFCIVALPAIFYLMISDFFEVLHTHPQGWMSFWSVFILSMFGTVLASLIFYRLIQITSAVFASMVAYLIPIVALIFGVFDGEIITIFHFLGMGLILFGVYISKR